MNHYIEQFKDDLAAYENKTGLHTSLLDLLWENYMQANPVDDGLIREQEHAIDPIFQELSIPSANKLSDLVYGLCTAYQRAALLEGVHIGFRLAEELKR